METGLGRQQCLLLRGHKRELGDKAGRRHRRADSRGAMATCGLRGCAEAAGWGVRALVTNRPPAEVGLHKADRTGDIFSVEKGKSREIVQSAPQLCGLSITALEGGQG